MRGTVFSLIALAVAAPALAAKPDAATVLPQVLEAQAACYAKPAASRTEDADCTLTAAESVWKAQDLDEAMQKALTDYRRETLEIARAADAQTLPEEAQFRRRARADQTLRQAMFGRAPRLTNPGLDPSQLPSREDLVRVFPAKASAEKQDGKATMLCRVLRDGSLADCRVVSEAPPGYGFGQAAIALASKFRARPATLDGQPLSGAEIRFALDFNPAWL